uniref:Uncharacterized protein n=1 Tax=Fagus sylvatica TaxID=28930 RepID=A0A2N9F4V3_FAGSY
MANKVVALFVCLVLVATVVPATMATEDFYKACFTESYKLCLPEKHSHSLCEKLCDEGCEALEKLAKLGAKIDIVKGTIDGVSAFDIDKLKGTLSGYKILPKKN